MGHFGLFALTALLTGNYLVRKLSGQGAEIYCRLEKMPFLAQKTTRLRQLDRRLLLMSAGRFLIRCSVLFFLFNLVPLRLGQKKYRKFFKNLLTLLPMVRSFSI